MKVRLLFFGATAALVGKREFETSLGEDDSPATVLERLAAEHPAIRSHKLLFAINQEYVGPDARLKNGDELAIFGAVSGG
jgi:molybdopterin converting factor small subunit